MVDAPRLPTESGQIALQLFLLLRALLPGAAYPGDYLGVPGKKLCITVNGKRAYMARRAEAKQQQQLLQT